MHEIEATVVAQEAVGPACYRLSLFAPPIAASAIPGQFVHVACGTTYDPLLRRPLTIYRCRGERGLSPPEVSPTLLELVYKVRGRGTTLLSHRRPGDSVRVLGPLGNGFHIDRSAGRHVLIGGGMGCAGLMALARQLAHGREAVVEALLGAHTEGEVPCLADWRALAGVTLKTWQTRAGLEIALAALAQARRHEGHSVFRAAYACGPRPVLRRRASFAAAEDLACQVSLEEHMACGIGACQSCVCVTKIAGDAAGKQGQGVQYSLVCKDGPVFRAREVVWGE